MTSMKTISLFFPAARAAKSRDDVGKLLRPSVAFWLATLVAMLASPMARADQLDCLVKPEMYVELSSPVDSVVDEILVEVGDTVKRGQPLVVLESSVEMAKLKLARLNAGSLSDIKHSREQLRYAKRYLKRMDDLLAENSVSRFEHDKAKTEVELAQIALKKAQEKWDAAQANLELAQTQLSLRTIKSPIDGIVVDRYAMIGESVRDRTIMKLAKVDPLKVELIAPTEYFGVIKKGMRVAIYPEQPADRSFIATVSVVDQLIDPASGSFTVSMLLPNPDENLIGGVNCVADLSYEPPEPAKHGKFGLALSQTLNFGN